MAHDEAWRKTAQTLKETAHRPGWLRRSLAMTMLLDAVLSGTDIASQRDHRIANILSKGRPKWKRESGYYLQSHAENVFFRYQIILGGD